MGEAPYFAYGAVTLTGSDSSLDSISSNRIHHNDIAVVLENNQIYFFKLDSESEESHNPPYVIKPKDDPDKKRGKLVSQRYYTTDIIQLVENYIQTSHIKAISGEEIEIESSQGSKIIIHKDGTVTFPSYVTAEHPTDPYHLTTKGYVDFEIESAQNSLLEYIDDEVYELEGDLKNYIDQQIEITKGEVIQYVDTDVDEIGTELNNLDQEIIDLNQELIDYIDGEISDLESRVIYRIDMTFDSKETELNNRIDTEIEKSEGHVEYYIEKKYNDVKDYADDEVATLEQKYPLLNFNIDEDQGDEDNELYYKDIEHNKGVNYPIVNCGNKETNKFIDPEDIESIDGNTIRIGMVEQRNLRVVVL